MVTHMHREIADLKHSLLELSAEVEKSIQFAGRALQTFDVDLAKKTINNDERINDLEVKIEEDCLKILALYQPVAHDLRIVVAVLKINNDLERMGDLAVNICRYLRKVAKAGEVVVSPLFAQMFTTCLKMVRMCLDSFLNEDICLAAKVCDTDEQVDAMNLDIIKEIQEVLQTSPQNINSHLFMLSICRTVERIADYATNIAEDVYYMVSGKIIRHSNELINQ
ncbi:MAG: phosphate signaling complex protein PhoU [Lentisphaeraceae bacterium]|nr:phosphate signaling complex protein PhoU [Lentisphaeraceae bacterium]